MEQRRAGALLTELRQRPPALLQQRVVALRRCHCCWPLGALLLDVCPNAALEAQRKKERPLNDI